MLVLGELDPPRALWAQAPLGSELAGGGTVSPQRPFPPVPLEAFPLGLAGGGRGAEEAHLQAPQRLTPAEPCGRARLGLLGTRAFKASLGHVLGPELDSQD